MHERTFLLVEKQDPNPHNPALSLSAAEAPQVAPRISLVPNQPSELQTRSAESQHETFTPPEH